MKGCMNALTFLVILAVVGFIVLALIGWFQQRGDGDGDEVGQAAASFERPVVVKLTDLY